jgi:glycosyltransferase involved in cell wall biosynthesis
LLGAEWMKISIITVVRNNEALIQNCLNSVLNQDYPKNKTEHIVLDGASTDGTYSKILTHEKHLAYCHSRPDKGIYDAMNQGIQLASGDIIGILNSDDVYTDNQTLSLVVDWFKNNQDKQLLWADLEYYKKNKLFRHWKSSNFKPGLFSLGWNPPHPTFFVKKKVYEKWGSFDLSMSWANDIELMLRFLEKNNIAGGYIPKVLVHMQTGGVSNRSIGNIIKQNYYIYLAFKKNGLKFSAIRFIFGKIFSRMKQFKGRE